MEERKECKIVQDLFPSYIEKLTDSQTNEFIEEHIKNCESCKEKLECMQNDIDLDFPKQKNKEVKFLKKYNIKLKTIQYIVLAFLLLFVFIIGRRYVIFTILENRARNTINENNYYFRTIDMDLRTYPTRDSIHDYMISASYMFVETEYYKDGTKLNNSETYTTTDYQQISNSSSIQTYRSPTKTITLPSDALKKSERGTASAKGHSIASIQFPTGANEKHPRLAPYTTSFPERVSNSFIYSIHKSDFLGKECYVIKSGGTEDYIDIETGLIIRRISNDGNYVSQYSYSFGTVTDDDLKEPDLSQYVVMDDRDSQLEIFKDIDYYSKEAIDAYYEEKSKAENQD